MHAPVTIGHNNPPGPIDSAKEAMAELAAYLADNPVIQSLDEAKQAGGWIERTRIALKSMEDERTVKVAPLNERLSAINSLYRAVREPLTKHYDILKGRLTKYNTAVEAARFAEAERLRLIAAEAELAARDAEAAEQETIANADAGECADVGSAIANADAAFGQFRTATRAAAIAEKHATVRIGSVMGGRSLSMRDKPDKLSIATEDDACNAIRAMGMTPEIEEVICKAARKFKAQFGEYPDGITATKERSL